MSVATMIDRIGLGRRRVTVYRRTADGLVGTTPKYTWPAVASEVPFAKQTRRGEVEGTAAGRDPEEVVRGYFADGVDLQQDDGIQIDESDFTAEVGERFQIDQIDRWGPRGGLQCTLKDTMEDFGVSPGS